MRLRGRPVAKDVIRDVMSVTYKDNLAEIDSFEVAINNWDAGTADVQVHRRQPVRPGRRDRAVDGLPREAGSA